jgi:amino acid transporter
MLSVLINGSLGFGMLLAMLFCLGDIEAALGSPTGYPFMAIFLQATGSVPGTAVMSSIVTTMGITTSVGMLASASRQFWSFARDRGIPGWRIWSQVCAISNKIENKDFLVLSFYRFMEALVSPSTLFFLQLVLSASLLLSPSDPRSPSMILSPCLFPVFIYRTWSSLACSSIDAALAALAMPEAATRQLSIPSARSLSGAHSICQVLGVSWSMPLLSST